MSALHALLLTDVVDSTKVTEALQGPNVGALWSAHDRVARDLLSLWRGREIDKSDGMLVLFDDVADAVGYALSYHRALRKLGFDIRARAGIHVGPVEVIANADADVARGAKSIEVYGIALPIAARIMSIAGGEQTLLSSDARLALGVVPQRIESHGYWTLEGIAHPIEVFEIAETDIAFRTPIDTAKAYRVFRLGDLWQPVRTQRHTLPAERDIFVGRQVSLAVLAAKHAAGSRLVSILGTGGMGKTRLALRFAWTRLSLYPGGIWFCDLSQARGIDGIHFAVAQGFEVPLGKENAAAQLGRTIASRGECLVLIDNFEQVAAFAEETLGRWLEQAPLARFVVTTREVLGIVGEDRYALPPLQSDDAVQLFVKRAKSARFAFEPDVADLLAIERLVKVLDYLPLAIELAAARIRVMPPKILLERMHDRFEVLLSRSGRRDRQATLRATFDWSWELLGDAEKGALARLSVFEGGFTLDAAVAVVHLDEGIGAGPTIDLVESLVDKSFVHQVSTERYDLFQSVRDYAAQHLRSPGRFAGSGVECEALTRARHWRHFSTFDESGALAQGGVEVNNLVAACRAASNAGDAGCATACLTAAWMALRIIGPYRAGHELAGSVEREAVLSSADRARVHWVAANALDLLGETDAARVRIEQGLRDAAEAGDLVCMARLLIVLGSRQTLDGALDLAWGSLNEARSLVDLLHDSSLQISVLNMLGRLMNYQSRFPEARHYYEEALLLARKSGDRRTEGGLLGNLGGLHYSLGERGRAKDHYQQALRLAIEVGDKRWEGNAHCNLGLIHQDEGNPLEAGAQFEMALHSARSMGDARLTYTVLCNLGILLSATGRNREAAEQLELAVNGAIASSDRRSEGQFRGYLAVALARQGRFEEALNLLDMGERLLTASGDRMSQALLLCDRADIQLGTGNTGAADDALARAKQIAETLECGADSEVKRRIDAVAKAIASRQ